jgi:hypothetical protein
MGDDVMIWPLSFLAYSVGRRKNVSNIIGGLERTNGGAASEAGLERGGDRWRHLQGSDKMVMMLRVGLCLCPSARVSGESEVFWDPLWEASDKVERWVGTLTQLARGPARGELARRSL